MSLLPDYSRQAETYDRTRGASPSMLGPLRAALAGAPGRRLADIGGGTGNYSRALQGLATIAADATSLPLEDESFDAAMLVSMLHHVEEPAAALAQARRILRADGRLAVMVYTREDIEDLWFSDFFPSTREWMRTSHLTLAEMLELLPGARHLPVLFSDLQDASLV